VALQPIVTMRLEQWTARVAPRPACAYDSANAHVSIGIC
jgi:hypothetical protein